MCNERRPHRRHSYSKSQRGLHWGEWREGTVCDLLWRLPKDDVPFVIVREEVDGKTVAFGWYPPEILKI
jgi:hypothetical protein